MEIVVTVTAGGQVVGQTIGAVVVRTGRVGLAELAEGSPALLVMGQTTTTRLVVEVTVMVEWNRESSVEK